MGGAGVSVSLLGFFSLGTAFKTPSIPWTQGGGFYIRCEGCLWHLGFENGFSAKQSPLGLVLFCFSQVVYSLALVPLKSASRASISSSDPSAFSITRRPPDLLEGTKEGSFPRLWVLKRIHVSLVQKAPSGDWKRLLKGQKTNTDKLKWNENIQVKVKRWPISRCGNV